MSGINSSGLISRLQSWAAAPFTQEMDLVTITLTTGLIVILVFFWTRILRDVVSEA